ncbi:hypothetical protein B0A78_09775 [Flavobacterium columnare NBRC 100251 = ATCC 23463]|nr:hypothetical protein B0A78_09775 [Flavobacterium columnare NBRC 100251 = ATCC 23463]GEM58199.1 hypothetical protein FC1_14370 [Flavobacterium columnare NBRC 100251 = ATCC 23463]
MNKIKLRILGIIYEIILFLPDTFSKVKVYYYNLKGCEISYEGTISPNVRIRGKFEKERGSSIA